MNAELTVDVLVVGFGCAGASAALEAARAGATVAVLDGAGGGGATAMSGGELYLGGGTAVQRACGFDDDAEQMYAYLRVALGPHADEVKLRDYCDGSVQHFEWFRSLGVEFEDSLHDAPTWMPAGNAGLMWLGENAWPFTEIARPAPRGHRPATPGHGGWMVMERLAAAVAEAGIVVHTDTRALSLSVEAGRVTGVVARRFGDVFEVCARRAVVLATGGFIDNETMVADHVPALIGQGKVSAGLDDGSGIRMALAVGAAVRRMAAAEVTLSVVPALACRGMLVNGLGQRFVNEDVYPGRFSQAAVLRQPGPWFTIVDERGWDEVPTAERWGVQPAVVAETLAEVERTLGLPPGALEDTVGRYNRDAAGGEDLLFHKDPRWLRPLKPPYAAVDSRLGFDPAGAGKRGGTGVSGFTLGGLRTNVDGEVLNLDGEVIPGLLAAGRVTSGIHGDGYVSGTSLGDGTFFGRRAGRTAAGA